MLAAAPMDPEDDLARALVDVGDDVRDEGAQKLLAGAHRHAGRVPGRFEIVGQAREIRRLDGRCRRQPFKPWEAAVETHHRGLDDRRRPRWRRPPYTAAERMLGRALSLFVQPSSV